MIPRRVTRFFQRHGAHAPRMALMALARTFYRREIVRRTIRPFVSAKQPRQWVFLVGCYNSGTTITQEVLAAHPQIATLPWEGALITSVLPNPEELGWTRMWLHCQEYMQMPPGERPDLVNIMLRDWAPWWNKQADVFLEKSITNVTRMAWLDRHLSNCYFIGMVRNGYCVAEGICRRTRLQPRNAHQWGGTYPIAMAGQQWVLANQNLLDGASQVGRYHQFSYESFTEDPIRILTEVWRFLELPTPAMSLKDGKLMVADSPIAMQVDTNQASLARLSAADFRELNRVIGPMQRKFGYDLIAED